MKKNDNFKVKISPEQELSEKEMMQIYGSGNNPIRYISDEFIQTKILSEKGLDIYGKRN